MSTATPPTPGGFLPKFHPRILGSAAPVFPGFEVDILERIPDSEREDAVWHRERGRAILKAHPEVKELFGNEPANAFWCLAVSGLHIAIAIACCYLPWWGMLLAAYCIGSSLNIMLFQLGHDCVHGNVFKSMAWSRWLFTFTTLPMFLSGHHTWWTEHLAHHSDMGAKKDFITRRRSFFLVTRVSSPLFVPYSLLMLVMQFVRSVVGLFLWLCGVIFRFQLKPGPLTLSVLADEHLASGYRKDHCEWWAVAYPAINIAFCGLLFVFFGWKSVAYLVASETFFTGFLHPYCLGWVLGISHFHGARRYQPTASHYGWLLNFFSFNAGLHVEHHDLHAIPFNRMWKLRKLAPEFYDNLETIPSYTLLALQFVFAGREFFEQNFNHEAHRNAARFAGQQGNSAIVASDG